MNKFEGLLSLGFDDVYRGGVFSLSEKCARSGAGMARVVLRKFLDSIATDDMIRSSDETL